MLAVMVERDSEVLKDDSVRYINITFLLETYPSPYNDCSLNFSGVDNHTDDDNVTENSIQRNITIVSMIFTSFALAVIILATVIGNVFVIGAIFMEKNLQTLGNGLVLSLAVADLTVACLVMPLGAVYEVNKEWTLGSELCEMWTSCDVLCCSASILHLLAIAVDRYWAVTYVDYVRKRNMTHILIMIIVVWVASFVVSFPPVFGWKDPRFQYRVEIEKRCLVSQDVAYQIFATCATFYVPLIAILLLYGRIYKVARKRIRNKPGSRTAPARNRTPTVMVELVVEELTTVITTTTTSSSHQSSEVSCTTNGSVHKDVTRPIFPRKKKRNKETLESKREKKAAKTLAIITGVFVVCWLPFFVTVLLMTLCQSCQPEEYMFSIFLWLGYVNSLINPIIYTIFSPDFRNAFVRILCGKGRRKRIPY